MAKHNIRVWFYHHSGSVLHPIGDNDTPKFMDVEAECTAGAEGIYALFHFDGDNSVGLAQGDDGHWWCVGIFNKRWLPQMTEMFSNFTRENNS